MFGVTNVTAAQASDYYKKDNYYLREGGGEWIGTLKAHFGLSDRVAEGQLNELVRKHEKFRTFDVKFILSRDLEHLKTSIAFANAHRLVIMNILSRMETEVQKQTGLSITFKRDLDWKVNSKGNMTVKAVSYNVAVGKCQQIKQALKTIPFRSEYKQLMVEELKKLDVQASTKQFNIQVAENSGRIGFDLTFSAPKSLSIAMTVNDQFHDALKEAHDKAVRDTLDYIQKNLVDYLKKTGVLKEGVELHLKDREDNPLTLEMAPGDRVIFLKNNHHLKLYNGQTGIVESVSETAITIDTGSEKRKLRYENYPYIDHYYACTTWKAEGESFKNVLVQIDTNQHNINSREDYFVKISRARENIAVFTDDRHSLLEVISRSKIPKPETAVSHSLNRLLLMTPEVSRLLQQGAKWNLRAAHYQTLHSFEPPRVRYSRIKPIARLQKWFRSNRSLCDRARSRAMTYYDRAIDNYKAYLDGRTASADRKEEMLKAFVHHYIPQSSRLSEIPVATIDPAERKRLLEEFFEPIDLMFDATFDEFTRKEYIDYAMDQALEGEGIRPEIEAHFNDLLDQRFFQPRYRQNSDGEILFGPNLAQDQENRLIRGIYLGVGKSNIRVAPQTYRPILDKSPLTREQRRAAEFIFTAGDQTIALNGVAGSGKTRLVRDVCNVLENEGYVLRGLSFTGKAAYNLSLETGINCSTMHSHF